MVIDLFTLGPSAREWSLISLCLHQDPLQDNGYWFPLFTSRPSARQWSSISLHQDPLRGNGHWFLMSHRGPLRGNGHRSLYIKTLCKAMVIWFSYVTSRPSARQWSSISLHQDPLRGNGHWFLSFRYRPSPWDWSQLFFKKSKKRKILDRNPLHGNGRRILWI